MPSRTFVPVDDIEVVGRPISAAIKGDAGQKQTFAKEVMRVGEFVGAKQGDDTPFTITNMTLDRWVKQFDQMKANGVEVPIPSGHEAGGDPLKNLGYVRSLYRDGGSLFAQMEMIGQDALDAARRNNVSIHTELDFVDCDGNQYSDPITHIALTPNPVVTNLRDFVPIAASRRRKQSQENGTMDLKKIGLTLGIKEPLTDANAEQLILARGKSLAQVAKEGEAKVTELTTQLTAAREQLKKTGDVPPTPDPQLVSLAADNKKMKLHALVEAGRITPAVADKLAIAYVGDGDTKVLELSLSRRGVGDTFDAVIAALRENDPVQLKEISGPQIGALPKDANGNELTLAKVAKEKADAAITRNPAMCTNP